MKCVYVYKHAHTHKPIQRAYVYHHYIDIAYVCARVYTIYRYVWVGVWVGILCAYVYMYICTLYVRTALFVCLLGVAGQEGELGSLAHAVALGVLARGLDQRTCGRVSGEAQAPAVAPPPARHHLPLAPAHAIVIARLLVALGQPHRVRNRVERAQAQPVNVRLQLLARTCVYDGCA